MQNFNKPLYYQKHALLQKKVARKLAIEIIKNEGSFCKILDVGCGTGFLGEAMRELGFKGELYGLDASPGMLSLLKSSAYNAFQVCKIDENTTLPPGFLYASSMFMQWISKPEKLLQNHRHFYFTQPVEGSLSEAITAFKESALESPFIKFKTPANSKLLYVEEYEEEWPSLLSFMRHLNKIGAKNMGFTNGISHKIFKDVQKNFRGKITWKIGFFKN